MVRIAITLFIITLCAGQRSLAQINVSLLSLNDTSIAELYLYADNKVRMNGLKEGDKLLLGSSQVKNLDANIYTLIPAFTADSVLTVKRKSSVIFTKTFTVRKFPDVAVRLDTIRGPYASISTMLSAPKLIVETGNFKDWFSIVAFDLGIKSGQDFEATPMMLGSRLSVYQIDRIKRLKPGDKLFFENIRATCPSCAVRALMPFTLIIQ